MVFSIDRLIFNFLIVILSNSMNQWKSKSDQTLGPRVDDSREILIALLEAVSELVPVGADTGVTDGVVVDVLFPLPPLLLAFPHLTCYVFPGPIKHSC